MNSEMAYEGPVVVSLWRIAGFFFLMTQLCSNYCKIISGKFSVFPF